jgi:hypothetical protein
MNAIPNRRRLLLGAVAAATGAAVAAIPAIAAAKPLDPVLGLVDAHGAAWARLLETEARTDDFAALVEAGGPVDSALDAITTTLPTTVAGMRAVIEYLVELDGDADYLTTLLRSSILRSPVLTG